MKTLRDLAKMVRSKNSGPFEITLDVIFDDRSVYEAVKASGCLTAESIAAVYRIPKSHVLVAEFFDPALAFKATTVRPVSSGSPAELDTYGGQQTAPLLGIEIPQHPAKS
ncbi:MAG: DUF4387 domain-containing protein [Reyranellaceae bacterium]